MVGVGPISLFPADLQDLQVLQLAPGLGQRPCEQRVAHTQRLQTLHGAPGGRQGSRHLGAPQVQGCQGAHACPALGEGALQAGGYRASAPPVYLQIAQIAAGARSNRVSSGQAFAGHQLP